MSSDKLNSIRFIGFHQQQGENNVPRKKELGVTNCKNNVKTKTKLLF